MTSYDNTIELGGRTFADRLRYFRVAKNISYDAIAELLDVKIWVIKSWESGLAVPELAVLVRLADYFGVSLGVMVGCESYRRVELSCAGRMTIH